MTTSFIWKCCIPFCSSPTLTFYPIPVTPSSPERMKEWLNKINQSEGLSKNHPLHLKDICDAKICPLHFKESDFIQQQQEEGTKKILENTLPTIFPWSPDWISLAAAQVFFQMLNFTILFWLDDHLILQRHRVIPAAQLKALKNGTGRHFCYICEFYTTDLRSWRSHMMITHSRQSFNSNNPNQANNRMHSANDQGDNSRNLKNRSFQNSTQPRSFNPNPARPFKRKFYKTKNWSSGHPSAK